MKGDQHRITNVHNATASHASNIDDVSVDADLERGNCIVDIQLAMDCTIDNREAVITDMLIAGYKLRDEQLYQLTFLKEFE